MNTYYVFIILRYCKLYIQCGYKLFLKVGPETAILITTQSNVLAVFYHNQGFLEILILILKKKNISIFFLRNILSFSLSFLSARFQYKPVLSNINPFRTDNFYIHLKINDYTGFIILVFNVFTIVIVCHILELTIL